MARPPIISSPKHSVAASRFSISTATVFSTSIACKAARSRRGQVSKGPAIACSGTGVTARFRTSPLQPESRPCERGYGHGVAVGDYDNDGHPDLFVTRWKSYALYHNRGDGRFEDVTLKAGLGGDRDWPTSSAFADLDNDGDLDLYVCHYARWDSENPRICNDPSGRVRTTCDPRLFKSLPDHLFRNDRGRFVDITAQAGIVDKDGRGLGVVAADLDGDGLVDLFVANDSTANFLYRNRGGFRFEEIGHSAGVAANAEGGYQAGMGIACGDLDGDGLPDLAVTNFYGESTSFFHNLGQGLFADHTAAIGLKAASRYVLGFGAAFLDANNDGFLDLLTADGHISDLRPLFPCSMMPQLYLGGEGKFLTEVTSQAGPAFKQLYVGRGLAVGDLDNDGRLDAVMAAQNDPTVLFHNTTPRGGSHFITFRLEGTKSNRDGVGAMVAVTTGGHRQRRLVRRRRKLPVGRRCSDAFWARDRRPGRIGRDPLAFGEIGYSSKPRGRSRLPLARRCGVTLTAGRLRWDCEPPNGGGSALAWGVSPRLMQFRRSAASVGSHSSLCVQPVRNSSRLMSDESLQGSCGISSEIVETAAEVIEER